MISFAYGRLRAVVDFFQGDLWPAILVDVVIVDLQRLAALNGLAFSADGSSMAADHRRRSSSIARTEATGERRHDIMSINIRNKLCKSRRGH